MPGALIQLVAKGIQDTYLTVDPQITFFKILYRRHTNFAIESIVQNFSSVPNFNESVSCVIGRNGDLLSQIFLYVYLPAIPALSVPRVVDLADKTNLFRRFAWVRNLGFALIKEVNIEISGQLIDRQYGEWLYIWSQLTDNFDYDLNKMVGNIRDLYQFTYGKEAYELCIPLNFWFCRHIGLALPLIALAATDVRINIVFRRWEECCRMGPTHSIEVVEDVVPFNIGDYIEQTFGDQVIQGYFMGYNYLTKRIYYIKILSPTSLKREFDGTCCIYNSINPTASCTPVPGVREFIEPIPLPFKPSFINSYLYVNYVYLDTEERIRFTQSQHEYLIEQLQFNKEVGVDSPNTTQYLALNNLCKAHYWVAQLDCMVGPGSMNELFNYTTDTDRGGTFSLIRSATLLFNGQERYETTPFSRLNYVEPYKYHSCGPTNGICMYSFCLQPEDVQPNGAVNMSKLDQIAVSMKLADIVNPYQTCSIRAYTLSYNILRIAFNLGGLAFAYV